jgi:hypothetical protein
VGRQRICDGHWSRSGFSLDDRSITSQNRSYPLNGQTIATARRLQKHHLAERRGRLLEVFRRIGYNRENLSKSIAASAASTRARRGCGTLAGSRGMAGQCDSGHLPALRDGG